MIRQVVGSNREANSNQSPATKANPSVRVTVATGWTAAGFFIILVCFCLVGCNRGRSANVQRHYFLATEAGTHLTGFHGRETWGAWTESTSARIDLADPISGHLRISIKMRGIGTNAGSPITLVVGEERREFRLTNDPHVVVFEVDLSKPTTWIEFSGMHPVSPKELGLADDSRLLGIGISDITIDQL